MYTVGRLRHIYQWRYKMSFFGRFLKKRIDANISPLIEKLKLNDEKTQFGAEYELEQLADAADSRLLGPLSDVLQSGNDVARSILLPCLGERRIGEQLAHSSRHYMIHGGMYDMLP
jgi:hypothetical protein